MKGRSLLLAAVASWGSLLAATVLFWYWQRARRRRRNPTPGASSRPLAPYSLSGRRIDVVESSVQCEEILASKSRDTLAVVGLDCEWVAGKRRGEEGGRGGGGDGGGLPVALLQLAFLDGHCVLVRLCKTGGVPHSLSALLQDDKSLKFGVGIDMDARRLLKGFGVRLRGCVDLRHIAVHCGLRGGGQGLGGLAASLLAVELDKSWRLRCSDWECNQLSSRQVQYAATDVAVALDILRELVNIRMSQLDHNSKREGGVSELGSLLGRKAHSVLLSLCDPVVGVAYRQTKTHPSSSRLQQQAPRQIKRRMSSHSIRQRPLYDNCRLLAPDGSLLSTVDRRKIQWYLQRHLGTLVSDDPLSLKLNFEPAGKPGKDRRYYMEEKRNVCVVCGRDSDCIRKNIVPHEYRRQFPAELKEHMSHDVLLLCLTCHQETTAHCDQLKARLAQEYHAPLSSASHTRFRQDHALSRIRNLARALVKGGSIPEARREELVAAVAEHLRCSPEDLTPSMIQEVAEVDTRLWNSEFSPHAEVVVRSVREEGGREALLQFQRRWRQHFLDTMNPRFLPPLWNVHHNPHQL